MMNGDLGKDAATLRLVAAPGLLDGKYAVGADIVMTPGSHTYWKMPGEAGVPPVFSFNGSENVAAAEVRFPTPKRITEEGIEAFGYSDSVDFPIQVTPKDAAKPAILRADVTFAVCNKICIPVHRKAELTLPVGASPDGGDLVRKAVARVPATMSAAARADLAVTPVRGQAKPTWTLSWTGKTPTDDIFANAPEGYYFDTKRKGRQSWALVAAQVVTADGATRVPVELTLARKDGGLVTTEMLDVGAPAK